MLRLLRVRQEFKRRQVGCLAAWVGTSPESGDMLLVQSIFRDQGAWREISELIRSSLDLEDGGIEHLLLGPPLIGVFEVEEEEFPLHQH